MRLFPLFQAPNLCALHALHADLFPALLQSGGMGWDILFASVATQLWHTQASMDSDDLFTRLNQLPLQPAPVLPAEWADLPFYGGWFFYAGYEELEKIEPRVSLQTLFACEFPRAALLRCPAAILHHVPTGRVVCVADSSLDDGTWQTILQLAQQPLPVLPEYPRVLVTECTEEPEAHFLHGVAAIQDYIAAGDVFQVNLSRQWQASLAEGVTPLVVYQALQKANPAPFSGLLKLGAEYIVSSSPERLLEVRADKASTRPIAGTHARNLHDSAADAQIKQQLINNSKERAEHVMLIDLERNDLGRICVPSSIQVEELMAVRSYAFVHHIESTVSGQLRPDVLRGDALRALFPGGTITGCPKVRTMQIIRELELGARMAYTGSMGYINQDGSMDSNILIRTFVATQQSVYFRAGAGIVAYSEAQKELAETRAKAKGLLRALGLQNN